MKKKKKPKTWKEAEIGRVMLAYHDDEKMVVAAIKLVDGGAMMFSITKQMAMSALLLYAEKEGVEVKDLKPEGMVN